VIGDAAAPPPPPPRTKWTRRVPHPVLIGHAASLSLQVIGDAAAALASFAQGGAGGGAPLALSLRQQLRIARRAARCAPRAPPRTNRTRRVPHPVLIGHAASLTPY
jgi:hypothetical protein